MGYELLKEFCISQNIDIRFSEPMSMHTSLKIGGPADIALFPDESYISQIMKILNKYSIPYTIVGGGTNILVKDNGIEGAVIFTEKMNRITLDAERSTLYAGGGCSLQNVINICVENGLSGMEGLAGIPGSIGGAIAGNAGSFGYEMKDVVESINLLIDGNMMVLLKADVGFEYRKSNIPSGSVILGVEMSFKKDDHFDVKRRVSEFINEKKSRQPVSWPSAGCVFKNPEGASAGKLIDEAGCKAMRVGGIEVSRIHANFFINTGGGTADDFLRLMDIVSGRVMERFGIILEPEIRMIGRE